MKVSAHSAILSNRSLAGSPNSTNHSNSRQLAARRGAVKTAKPAENDAQKSAGDSDAPPIKARKSSAPEGDAKKRVRLKPETREQLLERLRNPPLSLHETSILLRVSRATVRRYADAGRLPCLRTPGGQRRFALRDIETFYRQLKTKR
ncbi:MerR family transcriptional regulator [Abditibacterium utsteinense]|nr:helix-turn-helix domain-containing protein [Abditibacterium utsteinense]